MSDETTDFYEDSLDEDDLDDFDVDDDAEGSPEGVSGDWPTQELEPLSDDDVIRPMPASPAKRRAGFYMTPRQAFLSMAGVLGVILLGLVIYLFWLTRPGDYTEEGGVAGAGLQPVVAVYGPGREPFPSFNQPMGVAWSSDGTEFYVADARNNRICVFDEDGKPLREFGSFGVAKPLAGAERTWDPGELSYPVDVAVGDDGSVYVADFYNDSISVFDDKGAFVRRFPDPYAQAGRGSSGQDGGGIAVTAVAVSGDRVYATDAYQVFVFSTKGEYIDQFGRPGLGMNGLDRPGGIAVDRDGRVYVSDSNHNRVIAFTEEGETLWVSGRPVEGLKEESDNPYVLPRGLSVLRDGSILVADPLGQELVRIDSDGKVVAQYGVRGSKAGQVNFPNDVDASGDRVLVADRQNQRVQVVKLISR